MEIFIFIFFAFIIFSSFKKSGGKTTSKVNKRPVRNLMAQQNWAAQAKTLNTAKRSLQTGSTTLDRYKQSQKKRYKKQMKSNSGLWQSKHRVDNNRQRRTDWGARGDKVLLSPSMIGIIGGGLLTVYLGLTAFYG
jgi:hypothetical protein